MPLEPADPSRSGPPPPALALTLAQAAAGYAAAAAAEVRADARAATTCSARALGACLDSGGVASTSAKYAVAVASLRIADGPNGSVAEMTCPRTATSLNISTARATPTAAPVPLGSTPSSARSGAWSVTAVATRSASSLARSGSLRGAASSCLTARRRAAGEGRMRSSGGMADCLSRLTTAAASSSSALKPRPPSCWSAAARRAAAAATKRRLERAATDAWQPSACRSRAIGSSRPLASTSSPRLVRSSHATGLSCPASCVSRKMSVASRSAG
eukprot:2582967-Pleurochrysis_carterae.AAC.2